MAINNMKDLENMVNKYIVKAMELTRDEIFEVVSRKVSDYYNEEVFEHPKSEKTKNFLQGFQESF